MSIRIKEVRINQIITKDTYKAHLVESVIRQMIEEGKTIRVRIEEVEIIDQKGG